MDLSVIIPYCNEYPQIAFTVQSITNALRSYNEGCENGKYAIDWEIVAINNYTEKTNRQGFPQDKGSEYLDELISKGDAPYLKNLQYPDKLSHWNAKNLGVANSTGDTLLFLDAHVIVPHENLGLMYTAYQSNEHLKMTENTTLHLPLLYMNDRPDNQLIYRMRYNEDLGLAHYTFHKNPTKERAGFLDVPCMSSCGAMMSRTLFNQLGGFPTQLGIYGGGEDWLNFVGARLGIKHRIWLGDPLQHYAAPRGYHYEMKGWLKNRMIAVYLAGGESWLLKCKKGMSLADRAPDRVLRLLVEEVLLDPDLEDKQDQIEKDAVVSLEDWIHSWKGSELSSLHHEWV